MRRVTYSRNYTLSLSRTCSAHCKYCSFATRRAHLHPPEEVERRLDEAVRVRAKELLILTGERPDSHPEVRERLVALGHQDFVAYVEWACERALERGLLPHTNLGALSAADQARLRRVTASQGLMLESVSERLMETVHAGSPEKHPRVRLEAIAAAGKLRIPFTSGILVGIGESRDERIASLEALAELAARHGHIQEVILQNYVPHRRYYGEEVADVAERAAAERRRSERPGGPSLPLPAWASAVTLAEMTELVRETRRLMPGVGIQVPPNLAGWWDELVRAGATDLGGLSANGDHISPEHAFPAAPEVRRRLAPEGFALAERLCVYPRYLDEQWIEPEVLELIRARYPSFAAGSRRRRAGSVGSGDADADIVAGAIERARERRPLDAAQLSALFRESRPEPVEQIRAAADELRRELAGETVTFVVNRNINFTNVCTVGCAFCGFGRSRRSPQAYHLSEDDFQRRVAEAVEFGATEICLQGGIHPDYTLERYGRWLRLARDCAPQLHLHAYSPMEVDHMCERSGLGADAVFDYLRDCGLGSTPGTAAEVLDDGVRGRISPNKLPAARWVEIVEAAHRQGIRSTSTVMFGHVESPAELARHMLVIRELQERTGGITEFVPLSFIPHNTQLGRTGGIEEISRAENLKHTAVFRLALGDTIPNLQASWVKMGLDAATESLRWGVNDLGGTLMEESISRMAGADHGTRLEPGDLIGAARAAGRPPAQRTTLYEIVERY